MSGEEDEVGDLFKEPKDFYKPERPPTYVQHRTLQGEEFALRLVGHNPLWGHLLWQAGRTIADYLETNASSVIQGQTVLELGAGAGLPSLICAIHGARTVVVTDYPDHELIENLQHNVTTNTKLVPNASSIAVEGYLWGAPISRLTDLLPTPHCNVGFDLLILADLLFNHSEHKKLLWTVQLTLKKSAEAQALVFFTPYRPWLLEKDLAFFDLAREGGFTVSKILEKTMAQVMFEDDPGDELLRRTVFGYKLQWSQQTLFQESKSN